MNIFELEAILNEYLDSDAISDYGPNGLQIEGKQEVQKIITGVSASLALIERAIAEKADAILVHHGYFWKSESAVICGLKKNRIQRLLAHDINLMGYHLPLDLHPVIGNNACLARLWGIGHLEPLDFLTRPSIPVWGILQEPVTGQVFYERIARTLNRAPLHIGETGPEKIHRVAICSGAAQDYIELAASRKMDAFITGEVSERTVLAARELGIHFFAAGHHATERYGIEALGCWLRDNHQLDVSFIDIANPV